MKRVFDVDNMKNEPVSDVKNETEDDKIKRKKSRGDGLADRVSLNYINRHPRDQRILFVEDGHTYYVDGVAIKESVTKIKSYFCPKFDRESALEMMFKDGKSELVTNAEGVEELRLIKASKPMYLHKSRKDILEMWPKTGERGTEIHALIERFTINLNGEHSASLSLQEKHSMLDCLHADPNHLPLLKTYLTAERIICNDGWHPYRAEWNVFCEEFKYAGGADAIYRRRNKATGRDEFNIIDFKITDNYMKKAMAMYENTLYYPFDKYKGTMLNSYAIQLNLLAYPLINEYGLNVTALTILQIDPTKNTFHLYDCDFMQAETKQALTLLRDEVEKSDEMNLAYQSIFRNSTFSSEWRPSCIHPALKLKTPVLPLDLSQDDAHAEQSQPVS